jgi:hypothetical protein
VARYGGRWFGRARQVGWLAVLVVSAALLGFAVTAARAASAPVVYVYDVQVNGTLRATLGLPSKPLRSDFAYTEISKWTETYKGVRLEVRTSEFGEPRIEMKMAGKGTVTGSIKYGLSGPHIKSCGLSSTRPEAGSFNLGGNPYSASGQGAVTYALRLYTGRSGNAPALRSSRCSYFEGNAAKFSGTRIASGDGMATGYIDTRRLTFTVEFHTPQQPGQLSLPLNRMHTGAGFVLTLKGKTKGGRKSSEGTARITFVPRPS